MAAGPQDISENLTAFELSKREKGRGREREGEEEGEREGEGEGG